MRHAVSIPELDLNLKDYPSLLDWFMQQYNCTRLTLDWNCAGGKKGWTPLHVAAYQGNAKAVHYLLENEQLNVDLF